MEECCDICGAVGVAEALVTCSQCKTSVEHMYDLLLSVSNIYCLLANYLCLCICLFLLLVGLTGKGSRDVLEGNYGARGWSNCMRFGSYLVFTLKYCMRTCFEEYPYDWRCEECDPSSKPVSRESCPMQELPCVPQSTKSTEVPTSVMQPSKCKKLPKESKRGSFDWEKRVQTGKTKYISVNEAIMLSSGAKQSSFHLKDRANLTSGNSEQLKCQRLDKVGNSKGKHQQSKKLRGGSGCTAMEKGNCNAEAVINNLLPDWENHSTTPASDALWKGSFSICDGPKHGGLNDKIQAHPPSQVRRKVYDFSKIMPTVIQFELVPCQKFWINLFPEYFPDRNDIGLYFFPSDRESSVEYISLLESLNLKRLALRKQIDDVELLVFTSTLLPRDCQQWKGNYFLWGVFHRLKRETTACLDTSGLKLSVQPPHNGNEGDCSEEVSMEIDMIGGVNVGRVDVAVRRKPKSSTVIMLPGFDSKIDSDSRHLSSLNRVPSLIVKREPDVDIPPGF